MLKILRTILFAILLISLIAGLGGSWYFLSRWIPTKGKTLLIDELEKQASIKVSIESMYYSPLREIILNKISVFSLDSGELLLKSPSIQVSIEPSPLLQKRVFFHATALIESPDLIKLSARGTYNINNGLLKLNLISKNISLLSISTFAKQHIPGNLIEGTADIDFHLSKQPDAGLSITGRFNAQDIVWNHQDYRFEGNVIIEGSTSESTLTNIRISNATIKLSNGTIEGLPLIGNLTGLSVNAKFSDGILDITELSSIALKGNWRAKGVIQPLIISDAGLSPNIEFLLSSSSQPIEPLAEIFDSLENWGIKGLINSQTVCRGPLKNGPFLDCSIHAQVKDASLTNKRIQQTIQPITANFSYDALTKDLFITAIEAHIDNHKLTGNGELNLFSPLNVLFDVKGSMPLERLLPWLPETFLLKRADGIVDLDLHFEGPIAGLKPVGELKFNQSNLQLEFLPFPLEEIDGIVRIENEQLEFDALSINIQDELLILTANYSPKSSQLNTTIKFEHGQLVLNTRWDDKLLTIEQALLEYSGGNLEVHGVVDRTNDLSGTLEFTGMFEPQTIEYIPFVIIPEWLNYLSPEGVITLKGQWLGPLTHWEQAASQIQVHADQLTLHDILIENLITNIHHDKEAIRIEVPAALLAEGKITTSLSFSYKKDATNYALTADIIGLKLEKLTNAIPAWSDRSVEGTASTHATLSGIWQNQSSWQGKGWLHAEGSGLGDLPLMDNVMNMLTVAGLMNVIDALHLDQPIGQRLGGKSLNKELNELRHVKTKQISFQWQLTDERIRTEDLSISGLAGGEPVTFYATGSVGLDQTVDFIVRPELASTFIPDEPGSSTIAQTILRVAGSVERIRGLIGRRRLTGTIKEPILKFELAPQEAIKRLIHPSLDISR